MRIELTPTVYSDLLEIMEYYDSEGGPDVAAEFYSEFRTQAKPQLNDLTRSLDLADFDA